MRSRQRLLGMVGFGDPAHPWVLRAQRLRRGFLRTDERMREDYLKSARVRMLHIGSADHLLDGWLNTDLEPIPGATVMDAACPFPLPDDSMAFVFTEHMIEHLPFEDGVRMLRECHRVMEKGGVIRVVTPDLDAIARLRGENLSDLQRKYVAWFCETFLPEKPATGALVMNAHFRFWGHQFIYDEETLAGALRSAGFSAVRRHRLGSSDHPALRNRENVQRYPEGLLEFESMALEAVK